MNLEKIWEILINNKLSHPDGKNFFMEIFSKYQHTRKTFSFKLNGILGKSARTFYDQGRVFVNCFEEDLTPDKEELIDKINTELEKLNESDQ